MIPVRLRRLALLGALLLVVSALMQFSWLPVAFAAPTYIQSYYEHTVNQTDLYDQGCTEAGYGVSAVAILDFGRPAYNSSTGAYGTIDFNGSYVSNTDILYATEAYARGWYACRTSGSQTVTVGRGTSNYCNTGTNSNCTDTVPDAETAGTYWAQRVNELNSYISANGGQGQEAGAGGMDAEPNYDPEYTKTLHFTSYYNNNTSSPFLDYGSAEPGYWSNSNLWYISFGAPDDAPFPEIYGCCHSGMIQDWLTVDGWAKANNEGYSVIGVTNDYNSANTCNNTYTPDDAWNNMLSAIKNDSSAYYQSSIQYLTRLPCGTA